MRDHTAARDRSAALTTLLHEGALPVPHDVIGVIAVWGHLDVYTGGILFEEERALWLVGDDDTRYELAAWGTSTNEGGDVLVDEVRLEAFGRDDLEVVVTSTGSREEVLVARRLCMVAPDPDMPGDRPTADMQITLRREVAGRKQMTFRWTAYPNALALATILRIRKAAQA